MDNPPPIARPSPADSARLDGVYVVTRELVTELTDRDSRLGVGADTRDLPGSIAIRDIVARYKLVHRDARKDNEAGNGDSKRDVAIRILLFLKADGYRFIGTDGYEVDFALAYDRVWRLLRERRVLSQPEGGYYADRLGEEFPASPGWRNMRTYIVPAADDDGEEAEEAAAAADDDDEIVVEAVQGEEPSTNSGTRHELDSVGLLSSANGNIGVMDRPTGPVAQADFWALSIRAARDDFVSDDMSLSSLLPPSDMSLRHFDPQDDNAFVSDLGRLDDDDDGISILGDSYSFLMETANEDEDDEVALAAKWLSNEDDDLLEIFQALQDP